MADRVKRASPLYWGLTLALIAFGFLTALSIGLPFLLIGFALLLLAPVRTKPAIFRPVLLAVFAFIVGFVLVAPLGCTTQSTGLPTVAPSPLGGAGSSPALGRTTCANLLGIDYSGSRTYNPALWPALLAGLGAGLLTGGGARRILSRRSKPLIGDRST